MREKKKTENFFPIKSMKKEKKNSIYIIYGVRGEVEFVLKHSVECNREGMNAFFCYSYFPFIFTLFL